MHDPVTATKTSYSDNLRVVLIYAVFASLWILLSDQVTEWLFKDSASLNIAQTVKGWFFVGITSTLLYFLLARSTRKASGSDKPLRRSGLVNWKPWQLYLFAISAPLLTSLIRIDAAASFGDRTMLILFMFPIMLSAALGGFGPGLIATLIAVVAADYLLVPPTGSLYIEYSYDVFQLGFLLANGLLVSFLSMMLHEARYKSEKDRQIAESNLAEKMRALRLLNGIADGSSDAIFAKDLQGRYLLFNRAAADFVGKSEHEVLGKDDTEIFPPADARTIMQSDRKVMETNCVTTLEDIAETRSGRTTFLSTKGPLHDDEGNVIGLFGISRDITSRREAEEQLRKLSQAVEQSPESIVITNLEGNVEYVNESFVQNTGYGREEILGQNPRILHSGKTPETTYEDLWRHLTEGKTWQGEFYNKRKDGSEYVEHAIISPMRQPGGHITHYVAVKEDISEKMRAEAKILRLAFYDTLTGLPNRALLLERTSQALATIRRVGHFSSLISFNIDRFKTINDAGGQSLGDALLKAVSERLAKTLHEGDVVARIAGDEFCILLTDLAPQQKAAAQLAMWVSEKVHSSLQDPFHIGNELVTLTACLGVAIFPGDADSPLDVLRRANTALHHAKTKGSGQTAFFETELDEIARQRFDIERELHHGISTNELRVYLQPQVDASGKIVGAESLVRWQHPQRGLIPPGAFIPIAEESNLIIELGTWVLAEVCRLLAREDVAALPIRISVNISPRHFRQSSFVEQIKQSLFRTGADPTHLTLEITEGMVIDNINDVIAKMNELSQMGIHFSMDDFGTGYSSLSYLKRLPIHELKIDKSFIQDLTIDPEDDALVEAILAVAKLMHVKVVAEGVETAEQAAFLNMRGQVIHQGYLFGRPEQAETVIANIIENRN